MNNKDPRKLKTQNSKLTIHSSPIGIDASRALVAQQTGTEHYSSALLRALSLLPEAEYVNIALYVNSKLEAAKQRLGFNLPPSWQIRTIPFRRLWTHLRLSTEMATRPPAVLFVPSHVVPLWHPPRTVVTIHDLGYLYYPQAHTRSSRLYLHLSTIFSVRAAKRVIAISETTKRDLIEKYRVPPRKIVVIYHGRDPIFQPVINISEITEAANRYSVSQPYCVHVGTLQPRKNLGLLVDVWSELRTRLENPPQLLLAGKKGWLYENLLASVEDRNLGDLVKFADYVRREDLPALYSGALAMTFPSLYEGFGLPPLEAMACGTPVVASNGSSLPEVVGEAGVLLDPHDIKPWVDTIERLVKDEALRNELSRKGPARASQFTWEKCARETLHILTTQATGKRA